MSGSSGCLRGRGSGLAALFVLLPFAPVGGQEQLAVTELLALGGDLADEDGDTSDWIEVQNQGPSTVSLEGWYLTDDAADLRKWRFPAVSLEAGKFLVVFASGKNRAEAGKQLHTNFRLSSEGEFLALVKPDGRTAASGYAPQYPEQYEDVSFGLSQAGAGAPLVSTGATARFLVPAAEGAGDWKLPEFDDASWSAGATGLGYDAGEGAPPGAGDPVNLAPGGTATQSSEYSGGAFPAGLAIDGDYGNFTHTAAGLNLPATWELDFGGVYAIQTLVLYNRAECCASRLRDITVSVLDAPGGKVVFESVLLNPENVLGGGGLDGPASLTVDIVELNDRPALGRIVRIVRAPDPDLSGTGGQGNEDEADVLSLAEVEVFGTEGGYGALVATDVGSAMRDANASLYVRIPFDVDEGDTFRTLTLRVKYDDGFAAYLNGAEVARRNAPASLAWSSTATAEHPQADAVVFEDIDISAQAGGLRPGRNCLAIQALNLSAGDPDFLILPELVGERAVESSWRYFKVPTPGAPNDSEGIVGFVKDTKFSHNRGFHDAPLDLEITTATPGAEIRYTLDGSAPGPSTGFVYERPIRVDRTTTVRARAFVAGLEPTNVDTHTFLFVDDIVRQTHQTTIAAGFPASWNGAGPDYGFDPDVIGPNDRYGGVYAASIRDDLKSIPTLSIVLSVADMFGPRGIYSNPLQYGVAWERPASVELICPDGRDGFQVDCGIRIQGGWFRQDSGTKKHSFRLLFKREYGPTKLRFPLFGKRAAQEFDTITLRAGANDGYAWADARLTEQYTRDEFGRGLQRSTGNPGSHGTFVHLYIDGVYWGLYNPAERPDHAFSSSYVGGEKEDWDAIHDGAATNGDTVAFNVMLQQTSAARTSLDAYMKLQGLDPGGSPNPSFPDLLDVRNYIDYLVVNVWGGNWDWPWKNWWAGRDRTAGSTGFKFYSWDFENTMGNNRDRSPLSKNALQNNFSGAGQPHTNLQQNAEYKLEFADRVHRLFFNDGILTPAPLIARYTELAAWVERAIVAESARWGDQHHHPPLTLAEWRTERDWILKTYLPQRSAIVLGQFKTAGLYPSVEAPTFLPRAGRVDRGTGLVITAPAGVVHCTLDGSDPRLPGGAVSPKAFVAGGGDPIVLVDEGVAVRILVPQDDSLGLGWTALDYDDASWLEGRTGVGYDTGTAYDALIATDVESILHGVNSSIYIRIAFDADPTLFEEGVPTLALLNLKMKYDDGYVAYLNGQRVGARYAPDSPAWNSRSAGSHPDSQAVVFESLSLPGAAEGLRPGRNVLAIHGLNSSVSEGDFLILPRLEGVPGSDAIPIEKTTVVRARALDGGKWSALNDTMFVVDTPLRVTEIMHDPAPPPAGSLYEAGDFEFVELENVGLEAVDLAGVKIEGGVRFDFSAGAVSKIEPGDMVVLVKNRDAFASRYGAQGIAVAGEYRGRLANDGDVITLRGALGEAILDFEYGGGWYPEASGAGPSLVIADYTRDPSSWGEAASWRPSELPLGSPGVDESRPAGPEGWQIPGDINQDLRLDLSDAVAVLRHLFLGDTKLLPCGDGTLEDPSNLSLLDSNADGSVGISDPIYVLNYLFLGGAAPAMGAGCVRVAGCPDACR